LGSSGYSDLMSSLSSYDECFTPTYAVVELEKYLRGKKLKIIWEPTGVESAITLYLREMGYEVVETSILTNFDFLDKDPTFEFDAIITNPPYSKNRSKSNMSNKFLFLKKCYEHGKPFALLLPTVTIGGVNTSRLYRKHGIELLIPDDRIDFTGKEAIYRHSSWFCHDLLPSQMVHYELDKDEGTYRQKQNRHIEQTLIDNFTAKVEAN